MADDLTSRIMALAERRGRRPRARRRHGADRRRRAAAGSGPARHRGKGEGGEVDAAQRADRREPRADRRGGVHPDRHLVPRVDRPYARIHPLAGDTVRDGVRPGAEGALEVDLGGRDPDDIDHLEIGWPTSRLDDVVLIDTPGIASISAEVSARTHRALSAAEDDGRRSPTRCSTCCGTPTRATCGSSSRSTTTKWRTGRR